MIGLRLPNGALDAFTNRAPFDERQTRHGALPADHVLRLKQPGMLAADNLEAVAVSEFYRTWSPT